MKTYKPHQTQYSDTIAEIFRDEITVSDDVVQSHSPCRDITLQVTEDCNCACTYCYQIAKTKESMSVSTAKSIIDMLFDMWYANEDSGFINRKDTKAIVLDFIGGEPFLNMDVVEFVCTYFYERCLKEKHPWALTWMASFSSNGTLYFTDRVQNFIKKFQGHISLGITVDGPKEIHDKCRLYKNSDKGCFDDANAALDHYMKTYDISPGTKVTIAPENLTELNKIAKFFIDKGVHDIHANPIYEHEWTEEEAGIYYQQLKMLANTLIESENDVYCSLFDETAFVTDRNEGNFCGGTGAMLSFDPRGIAYPCVRYMATSLGDSVEPIIIGDCKNGIYTTKEQKELKEYLDSITRRSQSTDECYNCPIGAGCSWCSAWNYQETGTINHRSTHICNMHKARSLANVFFWNKVYIDSNGKAGVNMKRNLSDEESLKFITEDELKLLDILYKEAKNIKENINGD